MERDFAAELPDAIEKAVALSRADEQKSALVLGGFTRACVDRVVETLNDLLDQFS
jgi:hypothetical protein